jgi:myo-inositol-1(or 4)-monophosphatase
MQHFRKPVERSLKPDGTEVSEADLAVDAFLKLTLVGARPEYGWLSEETTDSRARLSVRRLWIVDPIDGTRAFLKGVAEWTICAALAEDGEIVLAAVYNPASEEMFTARKGKGAWLNGQPIRARDASRLEGARLAGSKGLFKKDFWNQPPNKPWPDMDVSWVYSVAYRICIVAAGRVMGAASLTAMHEWDVGAACLVIQEAGGVITESTGEPMRFNKEHPLTAGVIAAGPEMHRLLAERIGPVARAQRQ